MKKFLGTSALLVVLALTLASSAFSVTQATYQGPFNVKTGGDAGFGAFTEKFSATVPTVKGLYTAFGKPNRVTNVSTGGCDLSWTAIGVRAEIATFGVAHGCQTNGTFTGAFLSDKRWTTPQGIHPGSSAADASAAGTFCPKRKCGRAGYTFGSHLSGCGPGRIPNVIAPVRGGKVPYLLVLSHGCE